MRRSAMPQTRATGLPYSGDKYITGEMRERFCANPADTGRRQAKRRLTLGDGGLSVWKEAHCTFRPAGFCLRRKNRSFCPPVAKTSDSCPLTRYVVDLFNDFLLMESHFFQTPHFYGLYLAKNRSSCPEAAKTNDSSQLTKENARFGHDRLKWASYALQQSGSPLARIAFNMQLAANGS